MAGLEGGQPRPEQQLVVGRREPGRMLVALARLGVASLRRELVPLAGQLVGAVEDERSPARNGTCVRTGRENFR